MEMPSNKPPEFDWIVACLWVVLGGYAGLMRYLMQTVQGGMRPRFLRALLEFFAAISSGTTVMLLCSALGWSAMWTGVLVSASGWLGPLGVMRMVQAVAMKRMGITPNDIPSENDNVRSQ